MQSHSDNNNHKPKDRSEAPLFKDSDLSPIQQERSSVLRPALEHLKNKLQLLDVALNEMFVEYTGNQTKVAVYSQFLNRRNYVHGKTRNIIHPNFPPKNTELHLLKILEKHNYHNSESQEERKIYDALQNYITEKGLVLEETKSKQNKTHATNADNNNPLSLSKGINARKRNQSAEFNSEEDNHNHHHANKISKSNSNDPIESVESILAKPIQFANPNNPVVRTIFAQLYPGKHMTFPKPPAETASSTTGSNAMTLPVNSNTVSMKSNNSEAPNTQSIQQSSPVSVEEIHPSFLMYRESMLNAEKRLKNVSAGPAIKTHQNPRINFKNTLIKSNQPSLPSAVPKPNTSSHLFKSDNRLPRPVSQPSVNSNNSSVSSSTVSNNISQEKRNTK